MKNISIISDSTCDLSKELLEKYDVSIIPLHVHLGDKEYLDTINITSEKIFKWSDETKETPKTSAPSIIEARDVMKKVLRDSKEIICFSISSTMSGSNNVMRLAKEELVEEDETLEDRIHIINSMNLSTGISLQILEAADMINQGKTSKEIVSEILEMQKKVKTGFVVDTLTFLHRGGRCSGTTALVGSALKIHPSIIVSNGEMNPGKKYRGKLDKALLNYINDIKEDLLKANPKNIFITHSCDEEIVNMVKNELNLLNHFENIYVTETGGIVSSHCGKGTLGIFYCSK